MPSLRTYRLLSLSGEEVGTVQGYDITTAATAAEAQGHTVLDLRPTGVVVES